MQPQSTSRPVMDIAAPPRPEPSGSGPRPAPSGTELYSNGAPVASAPPSSPVADAKSALSAPDPFNSPALDSEPVAAARPATTRAKAESNLPVGLITVTILVMLLLGGLAVVIYLTKPA